MPLTDTPYVVSAVPHLTGTPTSDKASLWAAYQRTLPTKLFGKASDDPTSPNYQFHLRYLSLLKLAKAHYNQWLVPFWNSIANPAWTANRDALTKADAKRMAAKTPDEKKAAEAEFAAARTAYLGGTIGKTKLNIEELFTQVHDAYEVVVKESQSITNDVQAKPDIIGPAASRASTDRMLEVFDPYIDPPWARVSPAPLPGPQGRPAQLPAVRRGQGPDRPGRLNRRAVPHRRERGVTSWGRSRGGRH